MDSSNMGDIKIDASPSYTSHLLTYVLVPLGSLAFIGLISIVVSHNGRN